MSKREEKQGRTVVLGLFVRHDAEEDQTRAVSTALLRFSMNRTNLEVVCNEEGKRSMKKTVRGEERTPKRDDVGVTLRDRLEDGDLITDL